MNDYTFWETALASGQPIASGDPGKDFVRCGYFRSKTGQAGRWAAVAFWYENDRPVATTTFGREPQTVDEVEALYARCSGNPISYEQYQAVAERGEPWPDLVEELAGIGHNSQNAEPHELIVGRINDLRDQASAFLRAAGGEIVLQPQADKMANFADVFGKLESEAAGAHKAEKAPILEAGRKIDGTWKPVIGAAEEAKRWAKGLLTPYLRKQQEAAREAERRAKEAAAASSQAAPVRAVRPKAGTAGSTIALRAVNVTHITDLPALAAFLANMDQPAPDFVDTCRMLASRMLKAGVAVPGAELKTEERAA